MTRAAPRPAAPGWPAGRTRGAIYARPVTAVFRIQHRTALPVDEAWRRMTDWPRHAAHVPLTTITVTTAPPNGPGTRFVARSGIGRLAFDDPMEVVRWTAPVPGTPGHCRLEKRGTVVTGWAEIEVREAAGGSEVVWTEDLRIAVLPGAFDRPTAWAGRLAFGRAVGGLLAGR